MKMLVTGGCGFVGSHLVRALLKQGHTVVVLDDCSSGKYENLTDLLFELQSGQLKISLGSITEIGDCLNAAEGVDIIFHLAALKSVPESVFRPLTYNLVNVNGTINVLEAAVKKSCKGVVFASSSSVYGNPPNNNAIMETLKLKPISPYAVTKLAGEYYCRCYSELHNLKTVALRFFNIYGPGQPANDGYANVIPKFIDAMARGTSPTIFGDGSQARDYVYIDDVINALSLASLYVSGQSKFSGPHAAKFEDFNIGSGRAHTVKEIVEIINSLLDTHIIPIVASERPGDVQSTLAEIYKAEIYLGYKPQIKFSEGIARTVKYFQEKAHV